MKTAVGMLSSTGKQTRVSVKATNLNNSTIRPGELNFLDDLPPPSHTGNTAPEYFKTWRVIKMMNMLACFATDVED